MLSIPMLFIILHSPIYFFYKTTPSTILVSIIVVSLMSMLTAMCFSDNRIARVPRLQITHKLTRDDRIYAFLACIAQGFAYWMLIMTRTSTLLQSPWQALGWTFFLFVGAGMFLCLIMAYRQPNHPMSMFLLVAQSALMFFVAAIVYQLGYGYDPFIHRATEAHIFDVGAATPKMPFYIGQYISVVTLAHITSLSTKVIDIWLVPVFGALTIPLAGYASMRTAFHIPKRWALIGSALLLLIPFNTMIATTPHNLANIFVLLTALLFPAYFRKPNTLVILILLAGCAIATHPLTGIFAGWLVFGLILHTLVQQYQAPKLLRYAILAIYSIAGSILVPSMFGVFMHLQGQELFGPGIIKTRLPEFWELFKNPFYFTKGPVHYIYDIIYTYRYALPIAVILSACVGFRIKNSLRYTPSVLFAFFCLSNAFFVTTWLVLPNLRSFEQRQYAERLLHTGYFFLLPLFVVAGCYVLAVIKKRFGSLALFTAFASIAGASMISLYLLYPQVNPRVHFSGFHVTETDMSSVSIIAEHAGDTPFIALTNVITASAALDQYGFGGRYYGKPGDPDPMFYYSIPSGGVLYAHYLEMLYNGQPKSSMISAMKKAGVTKSYFVVNDYWVHYASIVEGAKKTADAWFTSADGKAHIFYYELPEEDRRDIAS
jgi:hypothetical protein